MALPSNDVDVNMNVVNVDNVSEVQTPNKTCTSGNVDVMNLTLWETPPTTVKMSIDDPSFINDVSNTFEANQCVLGFSEEMVLEDESTVNMESVEDSPATSNSSSLSSEIRTASSNSDNLDNFKKPFTPQRYANDLSDNKNGSKEEYTSPFVDDLETSEKLSKDVQKCEKTYFRTSLYRNFDPLSTPKLIDFNTPPTVETVRKGAADDDSPSNASQKPDVLLSATGNKAEETIKMLRLRELALEEQIIKNDEEICKVTSEKESYKQKCSEWFALITSLYCDMMHSSGESFSNRDTEKQSLINKVNALFKETDQALEDEQGVGNWRGFSELHYEKMKTALKLAKEKEEILVRQNFELKAKLKEKDELKLKADSDAYNANALVEKAKKSIEREITLLKVQLKKCEMKVNGLQAQLDQKNQEITELTQMIDELTYK